MRSVMLVLICLISGNMFSQEANQSRIDSLETAIRKSSSDTAKVVMYCDLSHELRYIDYEKALQYTDKALKISKESAYQKGVALSHYRKMILYLNHGEYEQGIQSGAIASRIFEDIKQNDYYLDTQFYQATLVYYTGDVDRAKQITLKALAKGREWKLPKQNGKLTYFMGSLYSRTADYEKAIKYLNEAIKLAQEIKNMKMAADIYGEISNIYGATSQPQKALDYAMLAMATFPAELRGNLGYSVVLSTAGRAYKALSRNWEAMKVCEESLRIAEKFGNKDVSSEVLNLMASIQFTQKKYEKALYYAKRSAAYYDEQGYYFVENELLLADILYELKKFQESNRYCLKILEFLEEEENIANGLNVEFSVGYQTAAKTNAALGNYALAYGYEQKFHDIETAKSLEEKNKRVNELQTKFEVAEKTVALKNITLEKKQKDLELQRKQKFLSFTFSVLILIVMIAGGVYWGLIVNKRKNKLLNSRNQQIEIKNKALEESQIIIKKSLQEKEVLLKEIHHRVKNNLQLVMSLLNIQARQKDFIGIDDFLEKGQNRIQSMALIHQNIYQSEQLDRVVFKDYLENLIESIQSSIVGSDQEIAIQVHAEEIIFDIQTAIPLGLIINELLCNAFKHAFRKMKTGLIVVSISKKETGRYHLAVADNGIGIEDISNVRKTLGIELVHLLAQQLSGHVTIHADKGTRFEIDFKESIS